MRVFGGAMGLRMAVVMMMVGLVDWIQLVKAVTESMESAAAAPVMMMDRLPNLLSFERVVQGLFVAVVVGWIVMKLLRAPRMKLPPGPLALPIVGSWLQVGDDLNHETLAEMSKKYGDVFLLKMGSRNVVVVSSPEIAKDVLFTKGVEFGSRSSNIVWDIFSGRGQDMVFTTYGDHWRKMRRIATVPFFTNKSVQRMQGGWEDETDRAIQDFKERPESATSGVVIRKRLQLLMYNVIYRMIFETRFESEEDPLFLKLRALNLTRSRLTQSFDYNYGDFIPILRPFLRGFLQVCRDINRERHAIFKSFVDDHKRIVSMKGPEVVKECGIDHILQAEKNGEINEANILYLLENLNGAGIETTLWSIEWGVAELVNNPKMQARIRDELDAILGRGSPVTVADTHNNKLPYFTAFVKEVMRFHMSIPLLVPHMNIQPEKLAGYDIPAQSQVFVNSWWIANNPEYWEQPDKFMPERFLNGERAAKMEMTGNDFRFLPFGVGRRSCPGVVIAIPVLFIVLGRLIQSLELLPPPGLKKVDITGLCGQFSNRIATHSTVVLRPRT